MTEIKKPFLFPLIILLGTIALLAGGKFVYLFFYMAVSLFLVPYLWLRKSLQRLTGDIEVSADYTEVGQYVTVKYTIKNAPSGRFPYLQLTNIIGSSLQAPAGDKIIDIEAGETAVIQLTVRCTRRGKYDLQAFRVKTGDPFGFFQLSRSLAGGAAIEVYPKLKFFPEITPLARQHFGNLLVKEKQLENYSQVSDLRMWREGDSIKRIHWKQSARHDHMVVKNFEHRGDATLNIFIDMREKSYRHDRERRLEDLAVETAASFIYFNLSNNVPVEIFAEPLPAKSLRGRHPRDYRKIMDRIITLAPTGKTDFALFVHTRSYYLAPAGSLYLITPRLNLADAAVFLKLKQRGFFLILFYLAPPGLGREPGDTAVLDKVKEAGIKVHILSPAEAADNESWAL